MKKLIIITIILFITIPISNIYSAPPDSTQYDRQQDRRIDTNERDIARNTDDIGDFADDIRTNERDIRDNERDTNTNIRNIGRNIDDITVNTTNNNEQDITLSDHDTRISNNTNRINNLDNRVGDLEKTQYVYEQEFRIIDTKKWTVKPFIRTNFTRSKVDTIGVRATFKFGKSYEEKLIEKQDGRIERLEALLETKTMNEIKTEKINNGWKINVKNSPIISVGKDW